MRGGATKLLIFALREKQAIFMALILLASTLSLLAQGPARDIKAPDAPEQAATVPADHACDSGCLQPCGPACLSFTLRHFGVDAASDPSSASYLASPSGSTSVLDGIESACKSKGLDTRRGHLNVCQLYRLLKGQPSVSAVFSLKGGHFCFIDAAREGEVRCTSLSGDTRWYPTASIKNASLDDSLLVSDKPVPTLPPKDMQDTAATPIAAAPLRLVYFHSPSCQECKRVKDFLPQVMGRWAKSIELELHSIDDIAAFEQLFKYEDHYKVRVAAPPAIFVGERAVVGEDNILKELDDVVGDAVARGTPTFSPTAPVEASLATAGAMPSEILRRFESFGPGAVAIAGLIDGINPCAFTTIVFFLSMLAYLKKTRREMMLVGAGFTVGMFSAYFLLGLGLLGAVKTFSVSHGLACGVAILAFALAAWSLIDAVRYVRSGDTKQVTLGLPKRVKERIHKVIRTGLTTRGLLLGSLSVGFLVSILESLCTGQVYLPTIIFMTRSPGMQGAAISYLLLYNVLFILPLLVILTMSYCGLRSQILGNVLRRHLSMAKLCMAGLFIILGFSILLTL